MKRLLLAGFTAVLCSGALAAESTMSGLFGAADQVAADLPRTLSGSGDLLIDGVGYNGVSVQLGDLFADLTANRLAGRSGFRPTVVKHYAALQYSPSQASWVLSGSLYDAGAGYLLTVQLIDAGGAQLKGWEFALGSDGMDDLLRPSVLASSGGRWDAFEPNDDMMGASVVETPFFADGLSLGSGDEDWFAFQVPSGSGDEVVILEAFTGGVMDTYLELYSPDDPSWAFAEDDDTDGSNAVLQLPLTTPGTWYLKVRGYSSEDEGEYSLQIDLSEGTLGPGEPDEGTDRASRLNVGTSPTAKRLDYANDEDWFRIDLVRPLGRDEVLRIETLSELDLVMELTDEYEGYIMEDDDSGNGNNPMVMATGLDAGTYYVIVYGYSGDVGPYEVMANITIPVSDQFEDDDSMMSASSIAVDSVPQTRSFSPPGDVDWVEFEVRRNGLYLMQTLDDIDTYMELYDERGDLIEENDDGVDYNAMIERRLAPGTYYLMVSPYGSASPDDSYRLSVESLD